jgi:DNA-directed RNA polymerase specialized sigma24 family protein
MTQEQSRDESAGRTVRSLQGDADAWAELYVGTWKWLETAVRNRLARNRVSGAADVEDILQGVWQSLFEALNEPRGRLRSETMNQVPLDQFLLRLAWRLTAHELRSRSRRRRREAACARPESQADVVSEAGQNALLTEFLETLPATLKAQCLEEMAGSLGEPGETSPNTRNQRRRRLRQRIREFFGVTDLPGR